MAHVGKRYPLAFRRDLAFDINSNQASWGRAYRFEVPFFGGSLPSPITTLPLWLKERDPGAFFALWQSEATIMAGRTVTARMFISSSTRDARVNEAKWELFDSVKGMVGTAVVLGKSGTTYGIIDCIGDNGPDYTPSLWDVGLRKQMTGFAANWAEWNAL